MAVDERIQEHVTNLYAAGVTRASDIVDALRGVPEVGDSVPSERTIYRLLREIRQKYTEEDQALDAPFQVTPDLPDGITNRDLPMIMEVWARTANYPRLPRLSKRTARWIATLAPVYGDNDEHLMELYFMAEDYSRRERRGKMEGKPIPTPDLDAVVAFKPWQSEEHACRYDLASMFSNILTYIKATPQSFERNFEPNESILHGDFVSLDYFGSKLAEMRDELPSHIRDIYWAAGVSLANHPETSGWSYTQIVRGFRCIYVVFSRINDSGDAQVERNDKGKGESVDVYMDAAEQEVRRIIKVNGVTDEG